MVNVTQYDLWCFCGTPKKDHSFVCTNVGKITPTHYTLFEPMKNISLGQNVITLHMK